MKNLIKAFSFIYILVIFISCHKDQTTPPPLFTDKGNIGAQGGTVKTNDGASVEIPSGTLSSNQNISVTNVTSSLQKINMGNRIYELKPEGLTFSDSITIKLPFDNSFLTQSLNEKNNDIRIISLTNDSWTVLPTKIDLVNKTATVKTTHFSTYAISYPSDYAKYFNDHNFTSKKILPVPYYNQRVSEWCTFFSTSMISKYAGYNLKAHNFACLLAKPITKGLKLDSEWESYDIKLNQLGLKTERAYPPWASVNDLCGYILKKLDAGLPVMVGSQTESHAFVVTGYDTNGFYVNDPSGAFLKDAVGNITGWGDCEMVLVPYNKFKKTLVNLFWDILTYPFGGLPEATLVITSKGINVSYGPTINFEFGISEFDIFTDNNQEVASLELSGIYQPTGYAFTKNNQIVNSFDGSNYFYIDAVISNIDQVNNLTAKVHLEIDDKDVLGSPFVVSLDPGDSYNHLGLKKFQLPNILKGNHIFKVDLRSTDSLKRYDSWEFNIVINNPYIINKPTVSTNAVSNLSSNSATIGGNITADGGAPITERGVFWGTSPNPETTGTKLPISSVTGAFSANLPGLTPNTLYYVKAYAINSQGPAYGLQTSFTTLKNLTIPIITTTTVTSFTSTTATVGGNVSADGGATVTERGMYWGTSQNPETTGTKLQIGSGTGLFTTNLSGLTQSTPYYVKAYAINSQGTAYGTQVSFTTPPSGGQTGTVTDFDGNVYNTVTIGSQVWMAENLKTTKYSDGSNIPFVNTKASWGGLPTTNKAFCWYNDNISNRDIYGALYTWAGAMNGGTGSSTNPSGVQGVCPTGWHLPSDAEWTELETKLAGSSLSGGKLKETGTAHWATPNTGATNESGFTGLPGGYRGGYVADFHSITLNGFWWSSTPYTSEKAYIRGLSYNNILSERSNPDKKGGFSVRCIKDN
jgi:uncharacterized protein (TIGR02145 family)